MANVARTQGMSRKTRLAHYRSMAVEANAGGNTVTRAHYAQLWWKTATRAEINKAPQWLISWSGHTKNDE